MQHLTYNQTIDPGGNEEWASVHFSYIKHEKYIEWKCKAFYWNKCSWSNPESIEVQIGQSDLSYCRIYFIKPSRTLAEQWDPFNRTLHQNCIHLFTLENVN